MGFLDYLKQILQGGSRTVLQGGPSYEEIEQQRMAAQKKLEGAGFESTYMPAKGPSVVVGGFTDQKQGFLETIKERLGNIKLPEVENPFGTYSASGTGPAYNPVSQQPAEQPVEQVQEQPPTFEQEAPSQKYVFKTEDKQPMPARFDSIVDSVAQEFGITPEVYVAMLSNESGHMWDPSPPEGKHTERGLTQIRTDMFWNSPHVDDRKFNSREEYGRALEEDVSFAMREAGRILRHKIDTYGDGNEFVGLMRYNGDGPDALKYAMDGYRRMGLQIPGGYF